MLLMVERGLDSKQFSLGKAVRRLLNGQVSRARLADLEGNQNLLHSISRKAIPNCYDSRVNLNVKTLIEPLPLLRYQCKGAVCKVESPSFRQPLWVVPKK